MKKKQSSNWDLIKNGVRKNGSWYASQYPTGWYFVYGTTAATYEQKKATTDYRVLGPFKTFEDGLKTWEKEK